MAIRLVEDVGAPGAVAAINIFGRGAFPEWHDMTMYAITGIGYAGQALNIRALSGDFVKNMAIASLPITIDKLYERFRGGVTRRGVAYRSASRVSRYPAPATESQFRGKARLV